MTKKWLFFLSKLNFIHSWWFKVNKKWHYSIIKNFGLLISNIITFLWYLKIGVLPDFLSHRRQCIRKSWPRLKIPGSLPDLDLSFPGVGIRQQSHQREQAQQNGCRSGNCPIGPLTLGLHAKVVSDFMKSDFQSPSHYEPFQDLLWFFG